MDYQKWIERIDGMAGIYSFDILPDGSFSEIRLMALNSKNTGVLYMNPDAPPFYPGIPWRKYFTDINFESYIYKCASTSNQLYSYANAHGFWLKGFYLPLIWDDAPAVTPKAENAKTVYCLYVGTVSPEVEPEFMSQQSSAVSSAVMNISIRLHQTPNYHKAMAAAVEEIRKACSAENCMLYTVDLEKQHCTLIDENGVQKEKLEQVTALMGRTPYENALAWIDDLDDSDCLMLNDLSVIQERDPVWYRSLCSYGVRNIILYAVRCNQVLVGFIWAVNFDADKMIQIKETLEVTSFLIGAVISNHQFVTRLEVMSKVDALTQVLNRNAMNDRVDRIVSGEDKLPASVGIAYADLNGLKTVNDNEGHEAGDKLLSKAAALMRIAFGDHEVYRAGGDEFVVICPDIPEETLNRQTAQLRALADSTEEVSFAIGTAFGSGSYDIRQIMHIADENMYKDKEAYYRQHPEKSRRRREE